MKATVSQLARSENPEQNTLSEMTIHGYNGKGQKLLPSEVMNVMKTHQKACDNSDEVLDLARELNLPIDQFASFIVDMPSPRNTRSVIYKVERTKEHTVIDDEVSSDGDSCESSDKEPSYHQMAAQLTPLR